MLLHEQFQRIADDHQVFVVATPKLKARMNLQPLGRAIAPEDAYSSIHTSSGPFLDLIQHLDSRCYAARRLRMPRWALYDCGELPGAIVGLGRPAVGLPPVLRAALDVPPHYPGLVPMTMFVAIPTLEPDHWLAHTICSIYEVIDGGAPAASRVLTIAFALSALRAKRMTATTQWASPELESHAHFGPLTLRAAWVPQHDHPATCVLQADINEALISVAVSGSVPVPRHSRLIDPTDEAALKALQRDLEAGSRVSVSGPPFSMKGDTMVPLTYEEVAR